MSIDLDVERLKTESFSPNSENTHTSSSVAPNDTNTAFVVPEVGFVIVAENWLVVGEKTRISYADARSILLEEADHKNQFTDAASSGGSDTTRVVSRERVSRILSLEGKMVAMNAPFGLGRDCPDAIVKLVSSEKYCSILTL